MTVSTTVRRAGPFTGNDVTTVFPFAFKVFTTADIVAVTALAGVETTLILGVDYSALINADQDAAPGGQITLTSPLASTKRLVITSGVEASQLTQVTNGGGFFPKVFNDVFDKAVILIQQLAEKTSRAMTVAITSSVSNLNVPVLGDAVLRWNPAGTALIAQSIASLGLSAALPSQLSNGGKVLGTDGISPLWVGVRERLTGNRTYWVSATGNDANTGLTAGAPFLTGQAAVNAAQALDLNGFTVTIQLVDGTYAGQIFVAGLIPGQKAPGQLVIQGNVATPANVVLSFNGADFVISAQLGGQVQVQGVRFNAAGANPFDLVATTNGLIAVQNVEFGTASLHTYARSGGEIQIIGSYTITGPAASHLRAEYGGRIRPFSGITATLTGTPAFSVAFAHFPFAGIAEAVGLTYTGGATGPRYVIGGNSAVLTNGGGANYFPGNSAGSTATGGQYL